MGTYIIRRILWGVVLIILVSALTFLFFNVFPSADPAVLRAGRNGSPQTIAYIRHELGLDKPIYVQFWNYMKGIFLHFNFGYSFYSGASVLGLIKDRLPATISLTVGAAVLWLLHGDPDRDPLRRQARWIPRPHGDGRGAGLRFHADLLAGADRPVPVRRRHRPVAHLPRGEQLRGADGQSRALVHLADLALVRVGGDVSGHLLQGVARESDRRRWARTTSAPLGRRA